MHLEEARTAAQNDDMEGVLLHLDLALNALGGGTQGNMTAGGGATNLTAAVEEGGLTAEGGEGGAEEEEG